LKKFSSSRFKNLARTLFGGFIKHTLAMQKPWRTHTTRSPF